MILPTFESGIEVADGVGTGTWGGAGAGVGCRCRCHWGCSSR